MKVLLASCASLPTGDGDDDALVGALADVGVDASWSVWGSGETADLVVLRSTWDYPERRDEFLAWCASVPALANPAAVVPWNTDKTYMLDLARSGVPVVPTALASPGFSDWPSGEFVIKPTIGSGSRGALRVSPGDFETASAHLASLDGPALVQPYQAAVDAVGETALVYLGGQYSHAFTKGAMLTKDAEYDESGLYIVERLSGAHPTGPQHRVAEDALDAAATHLGLHRTDFLYARVDLVTDSDGSPLLLELELVEPSLGFRQTDATAPRRFASAVRAALSRF
ncbi:MULTISPECIES: ATP-grasp domain-containing protein [unclassified Saccharothrix]|uniref:ATP-grasp domain-containing protein n=1 Tax=unclassified Saccharothrix TaxID=2593673 RepID=UPI00307D4E08